jgi:hypothetical protein
MTLAPPAARRLSLLGCALVATLALGLPGCGEEGTAAPGGATAQPPKAKARSAAGGCPKQLDTFVKSLDALRRRLAVGLSYEQYAAAIEGLRASYAEIPVDRLTIDCLATAGTLGERALNEYIDAANAWGECLADAACTTAKIEPVLQRRWRVASHHLSEAQAG